MLATKCALSQTPSAIPLITAVLTILWGIPLQTETRHTTTEHGDGPCQDFPPGSVIAGCSEQRFKRMAPNTGRLDGMGEHGTGGPRGVARGSSSVLLGGAHLRAR